MPGIVLGTAGTVGILAYTCFAKRIPEYEGQERIKKRWVERKIKMSRKAEGGKR